MNRNRFAEKHVIVTGAARGIGYEIARQFAEEGATLSLFDINYEILERTAAKFRKDYSVMVNSYHVDVSNPKDVKREIDYAESKAPVDILINNAGIATSEKNFLDMELEEFSRVIEVNFMSMFYTARAVAPNMIKRRGGAIVNMGSINSFVPEFGYANYNSSKFAVVGLTRTLAIELAPYNIRVNCVCPGRIATELIGGLESEAINAEFVDRNIPMNRDGRPNEVAPAFLFLASDDASYINGQTLIVDGGLSAGIKPSERDRSEHPFKLPK